MFGKFIIILVIFVLLAGGVFTVAATGLWQVPILTYLLRADKPIDLGVANDVIFLDGWIEKYGLNLSGQLDNCNDGCRVRYLDIGNQRLIMSSEELSSYINTLYTGSLPVSDIQIKLDDNNKAEVSAWVNLSDYGYEVSAPVYLRGAVHQIDGQTINIDIINAKVGLLPLPDKYYTQAEIELEKIFSSEAASIVGYSLDSVDITDGQLNISGQLPQTIVVE